MPTFVFLKNKEKVNCIFLSKHAAFSGSNTIFNLIPVQVADLTGANIDKLKAIVAEHK